MAKKKKKKNKARSKAASGQPASAAKGTDAKSPVEEAKPAAAAAAPSSDPTPAEASSAKNNDAPEEKTEAASEAPKQADDKQADDKQADDKQADDKQADDKQADDKQATQAADLDAAARDRFATSFKPAWQTAAEDAPRAGSGKSSDTDHLQREQALSGEISLDSIPLPPLPTEKPRRHLIGVGVVILVIIGAGIAASMHSEPAGHDPSPAAADHDSP